MAELVKKTESKITFLTEGLILGFLTLYGYLNAYCYEIGYLNFFGVPLSFARIEPLNALIAVGGFILGSLPVLDFFSVTITIIHKIATTRVHKFYCKWLTIYMLMVGIPFLIFKDFWIIPFSFFVICTLYLLLDLFNIFIVYHKKGSFEDRLEKIESDERKSNVKNILEILFDKFDSKILFIFIFGFLFLLISYALGASKAIHQKTFLVLDQNPKLVLIYFNDSKFIMAPFNPENKKISNQLQFFTYDEISNNNLILKKANIGPLELENIK